ncbi:hypothetical protein GUJ93_ZPchr0006g45943 [Zizania palustris]|uniref:Uncharacterized protein n=1 Tax=Zizania palustris TaxID=103762 RepID=A0A8J5T9E4_ZIZPA|nr:hypothetical protein GUJ93_ZPchr0006g45943 [Zizania palustris]
MTVLPSRKAQKRALFPTFAVAHPRRVLCRGCTATGRPLRRRGGSDEPPLVASLVSVNFIDQERRSSAADHKRQTINCYSGCPSSSELSKIWSFIMDIPNVAPEPNSGVNLLPLATDQTAGSVESTTTKLPYTPDKDMLAAKTLYEDFCMDDVDLSFENYEELFGTSHIQTEQLFDDAGIDSYFESKEMSAGNSDEQPKPMRPATSNAVSADSGMSIPGAKVLEITKIVGYHQCFLWVVILLGILLALRARLLELLETMLSHDTRRRRREENLTRRSGMLLARLGQT